MKLKIENKELFGYEQDEEVVIPYGVTSIGDWAFENCRGLISVTIPDTVTNIGESAFVGCYDLEEVIIPDSVTSIGDYALGGYIEPIIKCHKDSYAERYCIENEIDYEVIE